MKAIDWNELLEFYNGVFDTNFKTVSAMLRNGHKRFGTWVELALKLGVSYEMLRQYRKKHGV